MQVKRKIFPYPVINQTPYLSNYLDKTFELLFDKVETDKTIELHNIRFSSNSSFINCLYEKEIIKVKCIIECSNTVFRKNINLTKEDGNTLTLYKSDLSDRVEISTYAYANKDFVLDSNEEFDEDYQGIQYEIDKYSILAVNDGFSFNMIHTAEEDRITKSIFSIIPIVDSDSKTYEINVKTNKIEISMAEDLYFHYLPVSSDEYLAEEFFCILLIPALAEALNLCKDFIKNGACDIDEVISEYHWFSSVNKAYSLIYGHKLTAEEFIKEPLTSLAQRLLGNPLESALIKIANPNQKIGGKDKHE